ncbi:hypothetical protein EJB05_14851, partial [Eragrostis curvula]
MAENKQQESLVPSPRLLHVVVFPWLAFGHMIPFMELSQQLAKRGHLVTFVSTPIEEHRQAAAPVDGLPEGAESTADVTPEKIELLKVAFDGLATPFTSFLAEACAGGDAGPDWIVVDFSHHWLPPIADQHKARSSIGSNICILIILVPCALFLIVPAAFVAFLGPRELNDAHPRTAPEDFTVPPPWIPAPSPLAYRLHEAQWIAHVAFRPNASGMARFWETTPRCSVIIYRCSREVDGPLCPLLEDLFAAKPVVPAGRRRLPAGLRVGWVPQVRVLAHAAVGAFMTHAGLSSLMENFLFGHPIVMLPLFVDQGLTARQWRSQSDSEEGAGMNNIAV